MQVPGKKKYSSRLSAVRTECDGKKFDSKSEAEFYRSMRVLLPNVEILRPCNVDFQGKARKWKVDFGLLASSSGDAYNLGRLACAMQGREEDGELRTLLYCEFKGETDLQTGFIRPDKNFISRVNHLVRYEPSILQNTVFVGNGSGSVVTYCQDGKYCVTSIHTVEFFKQQVKSIWRP